MLKKIWFGARVAVGLAAALVQGLVQAQDAAQVVPEPSAQQLWVCPAQGEAHTPHLLGTWQARWDAQDGTPKAPEAAWPAAPQLVLQPHPEWDGNVKGHVLHTPQAAMVVGDVNAGEVTLEESLDGQRISATWVGDVVDGSCAQLIRGTYFTDAHPDGIAFTLQKIGR